MKDEGPIFVDTNVLVYAYDKSEPKKQEKCKKLLEDCFSGKREFFISNQTLAELTFVLLNKIENRLPNEEVAGIIEELNKTNSWKKINYDNKTVEKAALAKGVSFWDSLIGETMKENNVFTIYTENAKDFSGIKGVTAINPVK